MSGVRFLRSTRRTRQTEKQGRVKDSDGGDLRGFSTGHARPGCVGLPEEVAGVHIGRRKTL